MIYLTLIQTEYYSTDANILYASLSQQYQISKVIRISILTMTTAKRMTYLFLISVPFLAENVMT